MIKIAGTWINPAHVLTVSTERLQVDRDTYRSDVLITLTGNTDLRFIGNASQAVADALADEYAGRLSRPAVTP